MGACQGSRTWGHLDPLEAIRPARLLDSVRFDPERGIDDTRQNT